MTNKTLAWEPDLSLPTSKATVQHFTARAGADRLAIDAAPWGEADLTVNGEPIAHLGDAASAGDAFRKLEAIAEDFEATKEAAEEKLADQAIEDEEVRENLKRLRSRRA